MEKEELKIVSVEVINNEVDSAVKAIKDLQDRGKKFL